MCRGLRRSFLPWRLSTRSDFFFIGKRFVLSIWHTWNTRIKNVCTTVSFVVRSNGFSYHQYYHELIDMRTGPRGVWKVRTQPPLTFRSESRAQFSQRVLHEYNYSPEAKTLHLYFSLRKVFKLNSLLCINLIGKRKSTFRHWVSLARYVVASVLLFRDFSTRAMLRLRTVWKRAPISSEIAKQQTFFFHSLQKI